MRLRISDGPVEQSSVLALLRTATPGKQSILFSPSGFSPGAISLAESQAVALFKLDTVGRAVPETAPARALAPETEPDAPFAQRPTGDMGKEAISAPPPRPQGDIESDEQAPAQADRSDCPACGTTHYRGASLLQGVRASMRQGQVESGARLQCIDCGSSNIKTLGESPTS